MCSSDLRVWLLTNDHVPDSALIGQHRGLQVVRPQTVDVDLQLTDALEPGHIFVVDPLGHVMMRFPVDVDPNRMKKDIARLLRASRVG